ncbi:hypothetical protein IJI91_00115 [Candidatus Saccharibacteria bacterium]|nr:hypothetical protein [Candidatus Saccharibacteria bacterium]
MRHLTNISISNFINVWNQAYPDFQFRLEGTDEKPFNIEIRYPTEKFYGYFVNKFRNWSSFAREVSVLSKDTMLVPYDDSLYDYGVIEIKVVCQSPNFEPERVVDVLIWIGESLSPYRFPDFSER